MIEEQKRFSDIFNTEDYYILSRDLDNELLRLGFRYDYQEYEGRMLKGYCIISHSDCEIIFYKDRLGVASNYMTIRILSKPISSRRVRHLIYDVLNKSMNDLEDEILEIIKEEENMYIEGEDE